MEDEITGAGVVERPEAERSPFWVLKDIQLLQYDVRGEAKAGVPVEGMGTTIKASEGLRVVGNYAVKNRHRLDAFVDNDMKPGYAVAFRMECAVKQAGRIGDLVSDPNYMVSQ